MNRPPIIGLLRFSTLPLYAQAQQPDVAKLKADAQKVVSIIGGDKAKIQTYCQINHLGEQIGEANEEQDKKKVEALSRKVSELEKQLGPEYAALVNGLKEVDPNSPEGDEISSILENTRRLLSGLTAIVQAPKKAEIRAPGGIANRGPKSASKNRLRSKRKTLQPSSISRPPRLTRCLPPLRLN